MRVAIVHFHLQTGGVTRVIQHACTALLANGHRVVVLSGEPPQEPLPDEVAVKVIPALGYEERRPNSSVRQLAAAMDTAARDALAGPPDIWHIHNHCLGKNLIVPGALLDLVKRGARLLLQPHDFAEDGRPALYRRMLTRMAGGDSATLASLLYPLAPQIHYAVINGRDLEFLAAAGVPATRLHLLPNAVGFPASSASSVPTPSVSTRLWLYPTRAIRRKNLGELLLWATLASPEDRFATTQAPQNPAEQPRYRHWVALAQALDLRIDFAIGESHPDFVGLLSSSHALVSTSISEGFGLAFLEPWLIGRPLVGRDLPEITRDFTAAGIDLGPLYDRVPIPLRWLDEDAVRARMSQALQQLADDYGRARPPDDLQRAWDAAVTDDTIDFGRLAEPDQERIIRRAAAGGGDLQPQLSPSSDPSLQARMTSNRAVVTQHFMLYRYRDRLEDIYHAIHTATPQPILASADAEALLDRFQAPERLYLLKT
jgi:glycosyltransferase involved in cell wall biosynthesis